MFGEDYLCIAKYVHNLNSNGTHSYKVFQINALCVLCYFDFLGTCCPTRSKFREIFFLICSLGLGYMIWKIYSTCCLERNRGS